MGASAGWLPYRYPPMQPFSLCSRLSEWPADPCEPTRLLPGICSAPGQRHIPKLAGRFALPRCVALAQLRDVKQPNVTDDSHP